MKTRCSWANSHPLYVEYHDREWGKQEHDDQRLFEFLVLEGAQAGLSWLTILKKRENFRKAFDGFRVHKVARFGEKKINALLQDEGIIRNRLKLESAVQNAKVFLQIQKEFGSFDTFIWNLVGGKPKKNAWKSLREIPPRSAQSDAVSQELKRRGFRFVGSTICYAFMQACGMVNDHLVDCFRYNRV